MAGIAVFVAGVPVVQFARDNVAVIVAAVVAVIAGVATAFYARYRWRRRRLEREQDHLRAVLPFHSMNDKQFEHALASLCRSAGCREVEVSGGAGDRGADVVAVTADGRRLIVQAKRYNINHAVGDREMQQFVGGISTWHTYDVAVLVTTSRFTRSARQTAERKGIRLVDNATLAKWNAGTISAPWT
ncbi:restriction endonuclease [Nocardia carnea]|uniref:restriction endonuclease n=1 Tax=Nocardia carnea TaxID=37328 RepID=UPI002458374F|nr:restriction endonuclease [Nocardia carnea]